MSSLTKLFDKLDPSRASEDDTLREVAISMCAIDRLLDSDDAVKKRKNVAEAEEQRLKV